MLKRLFTRDFTLFIIGSLICSIADVAMSFVMSVIVYSETGSTLLSGFFFAMSFLPNIVVPLIFSPWVDSNYKKPLLVGCDFLIGTCYLIGYFVFRKIGFNYLFFMVFDLTCGCIGAIYQITYTSYLPCIIEEDLMQKGYTIFGMTYQVCSVFFTPIASFIYERYGVAPIMLGMAIAMLTVSIFDISLGNKGLKKDVSNYENPIKAYIGEIKFTINYFKNEKGLNRWSLYNSISNCVGCIFSILYSAYFTSNPLLGITLYSFLSVAEFVGRSIGSVFNFKYKYRDEHKARLTLFVYIVYDFVSLSILFIPYPLMIIFKFIAGFLGSNSYVLRASATTMYIPEKDRAKVNSYIDIRTNILAFFASVLGGYLGDTFGLKQTAVLCGLVSLFAVFFLVYKNLKGINHIFTYKKETSES